MPISLLDLVASGGADGPLSAIKLGDSETPVVFFTDQAEPVALHYINDPAVNGYVLCNGHGCPACAAGISLAKKLAIPVYSPLAHRVEVIAATDNMRPGSLLPQVLSTIASGKPTIAFITRTGQTTFAVSTRVLGPGDEDGAAAIKAFLAKFERGEINLAAVFQHLPNAQMQTLPSIAGRLALKGISMAPDAVMAEDATAPSHGHPVGTSNGAPALEGGVQPPKAGGATDANGSAATL